MGTQTGGAITDGLVPRAVPLAGPGQSPGLTSLPGFPGAGNGHEVYTDARAAAVPAIHIGRPADHRGRARRWTDHVAGLVDAQVEFMAWSESLPDSLQDSATAEALRAICDLDLSELQAIIPPRGFGRD
jgi:hypothetical protein